MALRRFIGDAANDETGCDLRYQGQLYDAESGLYYNRHRYYDPEIGQYISPDPIGLGGGLRPQGYVHNPVDWVDPFGLSGCPKDDRKKRHHSASAEYTKHTKANSAQNAKELSSGKGSAQYWGDELPPNANSSEVTAFRNRTEKEALRHGTEVDLGGNKGSSYYVHDMGRSVGYNKGESTQFVRVEVTNSPNPVFHGHPISQSDYNAYLKLAK